MSCGLPGASARAPLTSACQPPLRFRPRDQPEDDVVERAFAGDEGEVLVEVELDQPLQRRGTRKGVPQRGVQRLLLPTVERVHVLVR